MFKGDAVGIIGRNGAGKSTLLKLLSRVTAPSAGTIDIYGRITSMLEVGTGFNGEMTGRENIYMNGAILGMTKAEIDAKMEDIIEFSEVREFIDTPVKRYSSGMYVKLAFSVAAHLDSEIMIMDEVLAVGDMTFQRKCLTKMREAASQEGRTVLYVSHNMNTIRQLCDRCVVLNQGKLIFDGNVEKAIDVYLGEKGSLQITNVFSSERKGYKLDNAIRFEKGVFLEKEWPVYLMNEPILVQLFYIGNKKLTNMSIRIVLKSSEGVNAAMATTIDEISVEPGPQTICLALHHECLAPGKYTAKLVAYSINEYGNGPLHDVVEDAFSFETIDQVAGNNHMGWSPAAWGYTKLPFIEVRKE